MRDRLKEQFVDLGDKELKNIARPMRAYRVALEQSAAKSEPAAPEKPSAPLALPDKPSIAVLAFQNMSGDPEQEYFADGMVEEIITGLSRIKWLFVIARNSSFIYKGKAVDVRQVGRELGVRYVLEGAVRKAGDRVRITAQLLEAETGAAPAPLGAVKKPVRRRKRLRHLIVNPCASMWGRRFRLPTPRANRFFHSFSPSRSRFGNTLFPSRERKRPVGRLKLDRPETR